MSNLTLILVVSLAVSMVLVLLTGVIFLWIYKSSNARKLETDSGAALLKTEMEAMRSQVSANLAQNMQSVNQQIHQLTSLVTQNLQATTGQINTRLDHYSKVVQDISHQLGSLSQATEKIFEATKTISTLEEILKPPKLRGSMGEILLNNILKEILPSEDFYSLQYAFKSGNTVDAVIRLKEGLIPIDAKFPLDNFRRMIEAKEDKEREASRKEFVRNVKKHIDDIALKYILPGEGTINFALMYIPAENIYYEMILRDQGSTDIEDLYSYSTRKHVFPVSPNSVYPYLMTLALGFRGLKIEQKTKEILAELFRIQGDLGRFADDFQLVGNHLSNAQKKFGDAEKKLTRMDDRLAHLKEGSLPGDSPADLISNQILKEKL